MSDYHIDIDALLPAERIALTIGLSGVLDGKASIGSNTADACILALARLVGLHDWTAQEPSP